MKFHNLISVNSNWFFSLYILLVTFEMPLTLMMSMTLRRVLFIFKDLYIYLPSTARWRSLASGKKSKLNAVCVCCCAGDVFDVLIVKFDSESNDLILSIIFSCLFSIWLLLLFLLFNKSESLLFRSESIEIIKIKRQNFKQFYF